jgi:DNA-binding transcriptional LysR family regulator
MHSVLPYVLSEIRRKLPGIHTSLHELRNLDQIAGLKYGGIDIGFIRSPVTLADLHIEPVFSETLSAILPITHRLAGSKDLQLGDLAEEPFIGFCRDCAPGLFDCIVGLCNNEGFSPRIVHESSQINAVVRLVESGLGYSIVPTSVKLGYKVRVCFYELDMYPERAELALVYHPKHLTPTSEQVIKLVQGLRF